MLHKKTTRIHPEHNTVTVTEGPVYTPISTLWQVKQCLALELPLLRPHLLTLPPRPLPLRQHEPSRVHAIDGDGNCLFRALSWAVTGSERHHRKVRQILVRHLVAHARTFSIILPGTGSARTRARCYVLNSKMDRQGTWGSDVEILVAAHLLKSAIFVYTKCGDSWQWVQHDLDLTSPKSRLSKESVYLVHTDLTHYNVVTDIRCLLGQGESGTSVKTSNIVQGVNDKEYFAIVKILDSFYRNRKDRSRYHTKEKILRQALMNRKKNKRYPAKNYNYQKCGLKMCSTATQRNLTRSTGKCKKTHYGRKKYHLKPRKYYRMDRSTHRWQSKGCLSKRYPPRLPDYARQRVRRRAERSRFCGR